MDAKPVIAMVRKLVMFNCYVFIKILDAIIDTCPRADQVVDEQLCPRGCLNRTMNVSMDCIQCMPGCIGEFLM